MHIKKNDILWGVASKFMTVASALLIVPAAILYLSDNDFGIWFVFIAIGGINQLLEFGFQPTILRHASYVYGGATELKAEGFSSAEKSSDDILVSHELLGQLLHASKVIYRRVSVASLMVVLIGGATYFYFILGDDSNKLSIIGAWSFYALGLAITSYFSYFNAFLQGRGDITTSNKIVMASNTCFVVLGSLFLICGLGLLGIGLAKLLSSILSRVFAYKAFYCSDRKETESLLTTPQNGFELLGTIWFTASRMGVVSLGGYLVLKSNTLIISSFIGMIEAGVYGLSLLAISAITNVSTIMLMLLFPSMNIHQSNENKVELRKAYSTVTISSWAISIVALTLLILYGNECLELMGTDKRMLSAPLLITLSVVLFLEMNHSIAASYLTTLNSIPFLKASIISGSAIVIIGIFATAVLGTGVFCLILIQGAIQLAYNNWYWPKVALKHLDLSFKSIFVLGIGSIKPLLGVGVAKK